MTTKTKTEFLQEITEQYRAAGEKWPATCKDIAAWAISERLWKPYPKNLITQCASEIAAAMREEHFTDPQGRSVRKKRPFRAEGLLEGNEDQGFLWVDMQEVKPEEAEMAFQYGRKLNLDSCRQLKVGVDSYNDNNPHGGYVEMSFDFTDDLLEMEQSSEYPGLKS